MEEEHFNPSQFCDGHVLLCMQSHLTGVTLYVFGRATDSVQPAILTRALTDPLTLEGIPLGHPVDPVLKVPSIALAHFFCICASFAFHAPGGMQGMCACLMRIIILCEVLVTIDSWNLRRGQNRTNGRGIKQEVKGNIFHVHSWYPIYQTPDNLGATCESRSI